MKRYKSRAPKGRRNEGLEVVLWIIFGIPMLLIWLIGGKKLK